jgi:DNA topoisomerase-1
MMQYKFTKEVEADFDKVAEWDIKFEKMLGDFWEWTLKKDLEHAWANAEKVIEMVWKKCPKCKEELIYRHSKVGKFIGCSGYPECDFIDQPEEEKNAMNALKEKYEWKACPEWIEWTIVVKTWRFWPFLASSEYPKVKWIWKIKDEKEELLEKLLSEKGFLIDEESWEEMVLKNSRRWPFLAAKNYPKVKIAKNIPKEIWDELNLQMQEKEDSETEKEEK